MSSDLTFKDLLDKYETTKRELTNTESSIRRITGRDPEEFSNGVPGEPKFRKTSGGAAGARGRKRTLPLYSFLARKDSKEPHSGDKNCEDEDEEEEENDDEPEEKRPALMSTVVPKMHAKSRKATIQELNANSKIRARNKRMFGALVSVLERFQNEEKKRKDKDTMRHEIEKKVDAATEEEKEKIKKEKVELFLNRREKLAELRCLEKKIERAESHEVYDKNHQYMLSFIKTTKSKPPIFFCPSSHTSATKKCLEESRSKIQELIKERKRCLEKDLSEIEEWYKKDFPNKENTCPKDEGESQDVPESETESLVVEQEDTNIDNEDSNNAKTVESVTDQDFEPIYD